MSTTRLVRVDQIDCGWCQTAAQRGDTAHRKCRNVIQEAAEYLDKNGKVRSKPEVRCHCARKEHRVR